MARSAFVGSSFAVPAFAYSRNSFAGWPPTQYTGTVPAPEGSVPVAAVPVAVPVPVLVPVAVAGALEAPAAVEGAALVVEDAVDGATEEVDGVAEVLAATC